MQCVERQCCDATEGLDEFEEKIDAIDSTRDGSHPWLEDVLHQLRRAKQEAEAGGRQGEAAAAGDQGAPHLLLDTADGGGAGDGDTNICIVMAKIQYAEFVSRSKLQKRNVEDSRQFDEEDFSEDSTHLLSVETMGGAFRLIMSMVIAYFMLA